MTSNEREKWSEAMQGELKSIESNKAWELVKLPEGKKPIGYNPVARFESVRLILALAVQNGQTGLQMDVTTAFLNGFLEEEVYMDQPEDYVEKVKEKLVCRLNHSLYDLKQVPRCWNSVLDQKLKEI
uniref:Reverse transcriptase Ty1/copia-type domain-containing protein n=1 Tax=Amphimedon queenslandica TaxID=400682 RepID=A0A1X7UBP0_AMPQE